MNDSNLVKMIQQMNIRIDALEKATLRDVPTGTIVPIGGSLRPNVFARDRATSVGTNKTLRYGLNEFTGTYVDEVGMVVGNRGILAAASALYMPRLGQVGGMASEGSYGVNFVGSNDCRIELPLAISTQRGWTADVLFKPDVLPQNNGCIFYNGTAGTNGFGLMIGASAGGSGSKLIYRKDGSGSEWIDSGITLSKDQWYHAVLIADTATSKLFWFVGTLNPATKKFTYTTVNMAQAAPVNPTGKTFLGADSAAGSREFSGYIDDVSFYASQIAGDTNSPLSAKGRVYATMNPLPPNGWLLCDGAEVAKSSYGQLFTIIGTREGTPSGSAYFLLPKISGATKYIIKT